MCHVFREERDADGGNIHTMRSLRQSTTSSRNLVIGGSSAARVFEPLVKTTVHANKEFLTHGSDASVSRFCAWKYVDRNRLMHPLNCVELFAWALARKLDMLAIKRLSIGSDWGTTVAWQDDVARAVANIWMMHACRSVLMIAGNTSAASTRAFRESRTRVTASSVSWCHTGCLSSVRLGKRPAKTSTMIRVSSNSCSISSERSPSSVSSEGLVADGCAIQRALAICTITP